MLAPPGELNNYLGLVVGVLAALVSKYVINWRGAHVFNPAAIGALVASLTGLVSAAWWVATPVLLLFVVIIGLLILRKTRQFSLFFIFTVVAVVLLFINGVSPIAALISYPLVFLGVIMLTEPVTMPSSLKLKLIYGALVGVIFGAQLNFGFISTTPHVALLVGNLFAFLVATTRTGQLLKLVEWKQLSPTTYEFSFASDKKITYKAGQYFFWTLDKVKYDNRGNRRSFTIASSPSEKYLKLGVKFYEPSSKFKQRLLGLEKGEGIHVTALNGEFVLPKDTNKKLVFIAGGIGITPFRSMVKDLTLRKEKRDIVLFYFAAGEQEILYKDVWQEAKQYGVKVVPVTNHGKLDDTLLQKHVPEFKDRDFYLSGPPYMVRAYSRVLRSLDIPTRHIHTDYFSGY